MAKTAKSDFVFRKHMSIGEADAENDSAFLEECFVDVGDYDVLVNTETPQSIVLGRTGVGKSALINQIEKNCERVIKIEPEALALRYVSNSTILSFFESVGVKLDIFYSLLWQHTFAVELIKFHYAIDSPRSKVSFLESLANAIRGNVKKQQALSYIEEWGEKFWVDTESRIKEFTDKLESNLSSAVGAKFPGINFSVDASSKLTEEQRVEIVSYGKKVVSEVQIEKLSKVVNLLAEDIFTDPQKRTYILIDRLDEGWVEDELRYKLIRALIETIKRFRSIRTVKIVMTLRTDLLDRVLEKTRDPGFQREKYESLFLGLRWGKEQLKSLLDKRINRLLKYKYINGDVCFEDVFPGRIDAVATVDYILDRTLLRPRDAIIFVNSCLMESEGEVEVTSSVVRQAEKSYSQGRIESLKYEWFVEHPNIQSYLDFLNKRKKSFKVNVVSKEEIEGLALKLNEEGHASPDDAERCAKNYLNSEYPLSETYLNQMLLHALFILYKVGVVGVKVDGTSTVRWISDRTQDLTASKINKNSIVYVHKILWRALAIDSRN